MTLADETRISATAAAPHQSKVRRRSFLGLLLRRPNAAAGFVLLGATAIIAALAGVIYPTDPLDMVGQPFLWPGHDPEFPLGTDMLGRDIAAGIFHGARVSLLIGSVATLVAVVIGVGIGTLTGYYSGWVDRWLMRVTELFQTIPPFLFALAVVAVLQPSIKTIVAAIGITSWPSLARLVRAEVLRLRNSEMVHAAVGIGATDARIILLHILPNAIAPVIVSASIMVATAILTESSLAFLGLGDPNVVSWGTMVGAGREVLRTDWYVATIPGIAIIFVVLGLNLLGDGLNDALDPKQNRR